LLLEIAAIIDSKDEESDDASNVSAFIVTRQGAVVEDQFRLCYYGNLFELT
jgi:hypothetical protein